MKPNFWTCENLCFHTSHRFHRCAYGAMYSAPRCEQWCDMNCTTLHQIDFRQFEFDFQLEQIKSFFHCPIFFYWLPYWILYSSSNYKLTHILHGSLWYLKYHVIWSIICKQRFTDVFQLIIISFDSTVLKFKFTVNNVVINVGTWIAMVMNYNKALVNYTEFVW